MGERAVDVVVTGRVQGVSYRAATEQEAHRHGVRGWVRNEPDGSVAAHFEGSPHAVAAMLAWCREGPRFADVDDVRVTEARAEGAAGFSVRY
ncbi:acylphosphatase [Nocardioides pacificus]